jgi:2-hydroxychromene-2-carboxylate isomerase
VPSPTAELIARRVVPSAVVALSRVTGPARLAAAARRRSGRSGEVELYFAFDDPCSAVAVIDLVARIADRPVDLLMKPVLRRGIPGDPAVGLKRRYAIVDARRLGRRLGLELTRSDPLRAQSTAFLAEWVAESGVRSPELSTFCARVMRHLWFETNGEPSREALRAIWLEELGTAPATGRHQTRMNEARMARRGPYATPAAWLAGRWYFAQDRPAAIMEYLDELGWTERA